MVLEECPFCHKFLAGELFSKEVIDTSEALREKDALFRMGISIEAGERIQDDPGAFVTYKFTYKCRDCGKTWTKFKVEKVGVSKEYFEDEEDKTEIEADREEEDPKGEQFASEE